MGTYNNNVVLRYGNNRLWQTPSLINCANFYVVEGENNILEIAIHHAIQPRKHNYFRWRSVWDMVTFVLTSAIFKNGGYKCRRSQEIVYLKSGSPTTYTRIPQLLLWMTYLLRCEDIEFGSHFEKLPSPRYAQFLKMSPSRTLKPYVYITQINSQTFLSTKRLRIYRAGRGLTGLAMEIEHFHVHACKI